MNSPIAATIKTQTLEEAVREHVDNLAVNTTITVKDIRDSIRQKVNAAVLTLSGIDLNNKLLSQYWLPNGDFERQTVSYDAVKDAFLSVIDSHPNISWTLDSTNRFRIYRKDATASVPTITQTLTFPPGPTVTVTNPTPQVNTLTPSTNPTKVRTLAERVLDGSITHTFTVQLRGTTLTFDHGTIFFSKDDAILAVRTKLQSVLELSPKVLNKEIKSLVSSGALKFVRTKV